MLVPRHCDFLRCLRQRHCSRRRLPEIPLQPSLAVSSSYLRLSSRKLFPLQPAPGFWEKAAGVGAAPCAGEHPLQVPGSPHRGQTSKFVAIASWRPLGKRLYTVLTQGLSWKMSPRPLLRAGLGHTSVCSSRARTTPPPRASEKL